MAQRENGADLLGATSLLNLKDKDPMLAGVILDMSMNATIAASLQLGSTVLGSLAGITTLHQKRVEQAGFAVLKSPTCLRSWWRPASSPTVATASAW